MCVLVSKVHFAIFPQILITVISLVKFFRKLFLEHFETRIFELLKDQATLLLEKLIMLTITQEFWLMPNIFYTCFLHIKVKMRLKILSKNQKGFR